MSRWQDAYRVGQAVEINLPMARGTKWVRGVICRKTKSGQPEVRVDGVDGKPRHFGNGQLRKTDLRPVPAFLAIIHDVDGLPRAWGKAETEEAARAEAERQWTARVSRRAAEGTTDRSEERGEMSCGRVVS